MSRIRAIFKGCFRHNDHERSEVQQMEGVRLQGSLATSQESSSTADIMDTELFTDCRDFWIARVVFQFLFAMVLQDEDLGRSCINPKDVLEQVEHGYMQRPGENPGSYGRKHIPGSVLFKRINAARAANNERAFQDFLTSLSTQIEQHCQILRTGDMAELDAGHISNPIHRPASSMCTTLNNPSSEESVGRGTILSTPNISPPSVPPREELPLHTYTTLLKQYPLKSGEPPKHNPRWDYDSCLWYYEIILDGIRGVGEAAKKKDAEHMASRDICHALNIGGC